MVEHSAVRDCENLMESSEELVYRQIPAHLWDAETKKPRSYAFGPSDRDRGMPSYARSAIASAQGARDWHQIYANSDSLAVFACSTEEVANADLQAVDDSECPSPGDHVRCPGHCFVDYRECSKSEERRARAKLLAAALRRGEVSTVELSGRMDSLAQGERELLVEKARKWAKRNGRSPEVDADCVTERRHAEVLRDIHSGNEPCAGITDGQRSHSSESSVQSEGMR